MKTKSVMQAGYVVCFAVIFVVDNPRYMALAAAAVGVLSSMFVASEQETLSQRVQQSLDAIWNRVKELTGD